MLLTTPCQSASVSVYPSIRLVPALSHAALPERSCVLKGLVLMAFFHFRFPLSFSKPWEVMAVA